MPSFASMPGVHLPGWLSGPLFSTLSRLELSFDPSLSIKRLRHHPYTLRGEGQYILLALMAACNLLVAQSPGLFGKLFIVGAYTIGLLVPFTSQFVLPATPIFSWLLLYWSSRWSIAALRPHIWVSVLPTLESALYGANISDILTRYTSSTLDILAWIPYGVLHFSLPFVTAALIWIFGPPGAVKFFAKVFGYMNIIGVLIQIMLPCTPPWYEILHGQIAAEYGMKGSPGGLARIDALFGGNGYTNTFTNSPMPFGAFPSLHAGCSTTDALLLHHFFPKFRWALVGYVLWLYWSTMYLTHHYLIDLVAGASLAIGSFYIFLNEDPYMRDWAFYAPSTAQANGVKHSRSAPPASSNKGLGIDGDLESASLGRETGGAEDYELPTRRTSAADEGEMEPQPSSSAPQTGGPAGSEKTSASRAVSPRMHAPMSLSPSEAGQETTNAVPRPRTPRTGDR